MWVAWEFVREEKPRFVVNSVLPNANWGAPLAGRWGPTASVVRDLYVKGEIAAFLPSRELSYDVLGRCGKKLTDYTSDDDVVQFCMPLPSNKPIQWTDPAHDMGAFVASKSPPSYQQPFPTNNADRNIPSGS